MALGRKVRKEVARDTQGGAPGFLILPPWASMRMQHDTDAWTRQLAAAGWEQSSDSTVLYTADHMTDGIFRSWEKGTNPETKGKGLGKERTEAQGPRRSTAAVPERPPPPSQSLDAPHSSGYIPGGGGTGLAWAGLQ